MIDMAVTAATARLIVALERVGFRRARVAWEADHGDNFLVGDGLIRVGWFFTLTVRIESDDPPFARVALRFKTPNGHGVTLTPDELTDVASATLHLADGVRQFENAEAQRRAGFRPLVKEDK